MPANILLREMQRVSEAPGSISAFRRLALELGLSGQLTRHTASEPSEYRSLGQVAELIMGQAPPGSDCNLRGEGVVFVKVGEFGPLYPQEVVWTTRPRRMARKGDVLICVVGATVGKLNLGIDCAIGRSVAALRPSPSIDTKFLYMSLMPYTLGLRTGARGSAQGVIGRSDLSSISIWCPSLAEQGDIVVQIEGLWSLCDELGAAQHVRDNMRDAAAAAALGSLTSTSNAAPFDSNAFTTRAHFYINNTPKFITRPEHVAEIRKTVLNLAVRGRLVPQDPLDEPSAHLLLRLRDQQRRPTSTNGSETPRPFTIPGSWAWCRFPEVGTFGRGTSKHRPRNDSSLFRDGSYPFIQTGDVARSGGTIRTFTSLYNEAGLAQSAEWPIGTLCITIAANIACSGILSFKACFPDSVVGLVVAEELGDARYFEYFVRTARDDLSQYAPSTAQKNINLAILNEVAIPLPPLAEMRRIVSKVDALMTVCDELEDSLLTAQSEGSRFLQATLFECLANFGFGNAPPALSA